MKFVIPKEVSNDRIKNIFFKANPKPKQDGSGQGSRANMGRNPECSPEDYKKGVEPKEIDFVKLMEEQIPKEEYEAFYNSLGQSGLQLYYLFINGKYNPTMNSKFPPYVVEKVIGFFEKIEVE